MRKQKKPAPRAPKAAKPAAEPAAVIPGRKFATVRNVTLPVLALKIEAPVYVTFRAGPPRKAGADVFLAEVLELEAKTVMDLEVPPKLRAIFETNYPEGPEGKSFCIIRHAAHARKNAHGFTVEEIDPNQPADQAPAS